MKTIVFVVFVACVAVSAMPAQNTASASPQANPGMYTNYTGDCDNYGFSPGSKYCASYGSCTSGRFAGDVIGSVAYIASSCGFPNWNSIEARTWAPAGTFEIDGEAEALNLFFGNPTALSLSAVNCSETWSSGISFGLCV